MDTSLNDQSIALTSADSAAGSEYAADAAGTGEERTCGVACGAWINWRKGSLDNRAAWKATCSVLLLGISGWYFSLVADSTALVVIGACWAAKLLVEIWGQHTPTWAAPGTVPLFVAVYVFGLPSFVYVYGGCRSGPQVEIPHRDAAGLVLYFFGSSYSLWYEINRFRWKSLPQNKGRLHTIGLARHSIHPNYFGDLFTYTGWGLATGTQCALSMAPMSLFYLTLFVIPNSDAYLAEKYASEFPAYAARTPTMIPFMKSKVVTTALAWLGLIVSVYLQLECTTACGLG